MTVRQRRHRRKSLYQIVEEKAAIAAGGKEPADWRPDPKRPGYANRIRIWMRPCPKCGAAAKQSCRSTKERVLRWAFHMERWGRKRRTGHKEAPRPD